MTLVTMSTPYTQSCSLCGRKVLDKRAFTEDMEWTEMMFPDGGEMEIPAVGSCLYCSGELVNLS
jgi:hypothetical protein